MKAIAQVKAWNWPVIGGIVSALSGIAGLVLTPMYGADITAAVQGVLTALSSLLMLLPVHAALKTHLMVKAAKLSEGSARLS